MILGSVCTRACSFCNIETGKPDTVNPHEPENVGDVAKLSGLKHIVITSVDRDGTGEGFDIDLIKQICSQISIPVIVHGGASKLENMKVVSDVGGVGGLAIGSTFHYASFNKLSNGVELNLEGNKSFLKRGASYGKITPMTIEDVKNYLNFNNIPCRPIIQNQNE